MILVRMNTYGGLHFREKDVTAVGVRLSPRELVDLLVAIRNYLSHRSKGSRACNRLP